MMIDQESGDTGETPGPIDGWHYMGTIEGSSESPVPFKAGLQVVLDFRNSELDPRQKTF